MQGTLSRDREKSRLPPPTHSPAARASAQEAERKPKPAATDGLGFTPSFVVPGWLSGSCRLAGREGWPLPCLDRKRQPCFCRWGNPGGLIQPGERWEED